ncbi:hypothetical protein Acr_00g0051480 [Actinidia rufa]|uniref:Retrovirus-related Pol polyprotein from transposon TNT 1-94-like beta-barrel domain-containing protein n=1 Tax=Actinidia rufa TaxID=165716 RepID=A0A7J0DLG1_9ERIC|nr:hypothetical protein Acr_00g0051480 [Actinidia rufa]
MRKWRKMNRKTIGLIRQCIGHEVFHHVAQETSAYDLWIKLEEMYQAKTSRNKALLMRRLVNLKLSEGDYSGGTYERVPEFESWETLVVSLSNSAPNGKLTTSMVMDALFNEEARRREMGSTDQSESQALVSEGSRERGRGQGRGHHRGTGKGRWRSQARDTAATAMMAVDESEVLLAASDDGKSDWVLDSGSAYHLCRDREVFSTYAACEGRIWMANNTASRVVGRGSVRFRMADGRSVTLTEVRHVPNLRKNLISIGMLDSKGCSFEASGGILRVSKGNKEMLWGKKIRGLYRLEGNVQTGGATRYAKQAQGYLEDPEWYKSAGRCFGICTEVWPDTSDATVQDVHREAQRKETKSILRSCTAKGAATPKRVSFALDLISGGVLSSCAHKGGEMEPRQLANLMGELNQKLSRKDNLKTSDYPPVGWRGRLLSPAHLDESKPTWMSPSPVAKPKPDWSSYGVSM